MKFSNAISTSLFLALPVVHAAAAARASPLARRQDDIQSSLVLDPSVICTGCAQDGQDPPVDGQVASLTSTNNFINFCLGKELTDGQQKAQGSCNAVPMGQVIPQANMPASKITFPTNGGTFAADTPFTFTMAVENMILGNFVNAQANYFGAPQQLQNGILLAHSHVVVQLLPAIDSAEIPDPTIFAFFKGLNDPDVGGVLSTEVSEGLPAGVYRFCSMNTGANHQPANVAVAQHGSLDDCIYATAVAEGEVIVEEPVEEVEDPAEEVVDPPVEVEEPPVEEVEEPPAEEVEAPVEEVEVPEVEVPEVVAPAPPANNGGGRGGRGRGGRGRGRGGRGRGGRRGRGRFSRSRGGRFAL